MKLIISAIFFSGLLAFVSTLDEDAVKELKCKKDVPTAMLKKGFMQSVKRWYVPYVSKLKAYRYYSDILDKDIKDLTLEEIQNSCLTIDNVPHVAIHAFNQSKEDNLKTRSNPDLTDTDLHIEGEHKNHSAVGDVHFAMTDNESYLVVLTCWSDNEFTWNIVSNKPTIEPEVKNKAFELFKSLGFKVDDDTFYDEIKYDNCDWIKSLQTLEYDGINYKIMIILV